MADLRSIQSCIRGEYGVKNDFNNSNIVNASRLNDGKKAGLNQSVLASSILPKRPDGSYLFAIFPNTQDGYYSAREARFVDFTTWCLLDRPGGYSGDYSYVRAVRKEALQSRTSQTNTKYNQDKALAQLSLVGDNLTLMPKGMWKDPATGLIWDRCSVGQTWNGTTCQGDIKEMSWEEAKANIKQQNTGGYNDWQLPTIAQLASLRNCKSANGYARHGIPYDDGEKDLVIPLLCWGERPFINTYIFPNTEPSQIIRQPVPL